MTRPFRIREYQEADFHPVAKLWEFTGLDTPGRGDDAMVIARTLEQGGIFLVMETTPSPEVIGSSWMTNDGRRLYLHHFGIAPAHQRQGLGRALLEASLERALPLGLQVKLEVGRDNAAAIALYERYGFSRLGDYDVYIIRDLNAFPLQPR